MKPRVVFCIVMLFGIYGYAQVGINNTNPKATLDIKATSMTDPASTDGVLIPRIDEFSTTEPSSTQDGMLVFLTGNGIPTKGFYYWDSAVLKWIPLFKSKHFVGELYGGGIVYYVDSDGQHGLIMSLEDLGSNVQWGLYGTDVSNCESYIDGVTNATAILAAGGTASEAAGVCDNYTSGGFTDWYLPSIVELRLIQSAILTINTILVDDGNPLTLPIDMGNGASSTGNYWSSSEQHHTAALKHNFGLFNSTSGSKTQTINKVRAIRAF